MSARKVPTSGLSALAVVMLALAVIVVAGVRVPHDRVVTRDVTAPTTPTHREANSPPPTSTTTTTTTHVGAEDATASASGVGRGATQTAIVHRRAPTTTITATTTTTTSIHSTTTTAPVVTTTTTVPPAPVESAPSSLTGIFEGGQTSATARVGAVRSLTVTVPAGLHVTLSLTCGLQHVEAASTTSATVHLAGGSSCVATFSVPASSPEPARWRLTSS